MLIPRGTVLEINDVPNELPKYCEVKSEKKVTDALLLTCLT